MASQSTTGPEGPGETWELPTTHNLFLKGDLSDPYLDRNWSKLTGEPLGRAEFTKTSSALAPNLIDIQSAPLSESLRFQGNVTVRLFASLETTNDACRLSNILLALPDPKHHSLCGSALARIRYWPRHQLTPWLWRSHSGWLMNSRYRQVT